MSSHVCSLAIKRVEFKFEQFLSTTNQIGTYTLDLKITRRHSWLIIPIWWIWFELQFSVLLSWFRRLCSYLTLGWRFNHPQNKKSPNCHKAHFLLRLFILCIVSGEYRMQKSDQWATILQPWLIVYYGSSL